ncbi:conserved hypothetical protein [Candidatus Blochmanniella vafra str. BVAF]|uniref:Putative pre-16S rRNA nuclease n=1 Tax=Blochmanniella vafra (strain BVAF) TaxID=859654 RepID=E8Q634_BLOVB|nr:Holliday junction resolvase RuvX [Candidatus Blochmannia vafer]ADV33650.1 conserved hypothetical protein [Candidatus Blochmannia vafer str. BVAF]
MSNIEIIMAFDFGTKNIGVAVGQKLTCTTTSLNVLHSIAGTPDWKNIELMYNEWKPKTLIVGLPLQIDGSEQYITILSKKFAIQLKNKFNTTVEMYDERFTTLEARSNFYNQYCSKFSEKIKKNKIDSIAAEIILKSWLNTNYKLI